jgi:hypothetical protein
MSHPLRCRCGTVRGELLRPEHTLHAVCYCRDCQAYAHALGDAATILDDAGGTEVIATQAGNVRFTAGTESLACLSLTERGLLRWYAGCCRTPIANTPRDMRLSYAGVMHNCLASSRTELAATFGPVRMRVNTKRAHGPVEKPGVQQWLALLRIGPGLLWSRLTGGWRATPFFDAAQRRPVVEPRVLSMAEREQAMNRVA